MLGHFVVVQHERTSPTRSAGLTQELLKFRFEGEISQERFPNSVRVGMALAMVPDVPLKQHMVVNSSGRTAQKALETASDTCSSCAGGSKQHSATHGHVIT